MKKSIFASTKSLLRKKENVPLAQPIPEKKDTPADTSLQYEYKCYSCDRWDEAAGDCYADCVGNSHKYGKKMLQIRQATDDNDHVSL